MSGRLRTIEARIAQLEAKARPQENAWSGVPDPNNPPADSAAWRKDCADYIGCHEYEDRLWRAADWDGYIGATCTEPQCSCLVERQRREDNELWLKLGRSEEALANFYFAALAAPNKVGHVL